MCTFICVRRRSFSATRLDTARGSSRSTWDMRAPGLGLRSSNGARSDAWGSSTTVRCACAGVGGGLEQGVHVDGICGRLSSASGGIGRRTGQEQNRPVGRKVARVRVSSMGMGCEMADLRSLSLVRTSGKRVRDCAQSVSTSRCGTWMVAHP